MKKFPLDQASNQGGTYHRKDHEGLRKVPHSAGGFLQQSYRGKTTSLTSLPDSKQGAEPDPTTNLLPGLAARSWLLI